MSGYSRGLLTLVFDDPEFAGLEIICRRPSIGVIMDLRFEPDASVIDSINRLLPLLAGLIVSWNLQDPVTGTGIIPDEAGLRSCDRALLIAIVQAVTMQAAGVPAPLDRPSTSTDPSLEGSMPMETPSSNQPTADEPG